MKLLPHVRAGLIVAMLAGCAHPTPRALMLPATAAVRAPLVAAQTHVARALALGKQEQVLAARAVAQGIAAGSDEAKEFSSLALAHARADAAAQDQLTAALYQTGSLQRDLDARQAQIDALARDDAAKTREVGALKKQVATVTRSRWTWRGLFAGSLALDCLCGALLERRLRGIVAFAHAWLAVGYHTVAHVLKTIFPLYLCWLPA